MKQYKYIELIFIKLGYLSNAKIIKNRFLKRFIIICVSKRKNYF